MKYKSKLAWISSILLISTLIILTLIIFTVNDYGSLSKKIFLYINIGFLVLSLALILLAISLNKTDKTVYKIVFNVFLLVLLSISVYGFYLVNVVQSNVKDITTESDKIEYTASFVVYDSNLKEVEDLKNKTIGIISSSEFIEGNVMARDELEKLGYDNVEIEMYPSYTTLLVGLSNNEVDFASLPSDYKNLYSTNEQVEPFLNRTKAIHTFSKKYKNISRISGSDIDVTKVPFTVLLMGNDGGRTDTLMLASVNPKAMQVTLTSIARDSFVPIACYPNQNRDKINHARAVSRDCVLKTVENLLDISIDFFVEINFQGVVDLVDSLGTLTIDSPASFHGNIETGEGGGVFIPEGVSELDGNQVLAFARERKSFVDGDFQRQQNQQQIIDSLLSKVIETRDVNKLVNLVKATGKNVETNISLSQLIDLMNIGIAKMESTFLNNSEIFTIYGNRITGRGEMIYSPDYGMEIYYYVLYKGSIQDTQDFIAMNTRADGILEIPQGFNYSYKEGFTPPQFGKLEYYEDIDEDILEQQENNRPQKELVDKTVLQEKINNLKSLDEDLYTENSLKEFILTKDFAMDILKNPNASQKEVDETIKQIEISLSNLKKKAEDNTESSEDDENNLDNDKSDNKKIIEIEDFSNRPYAELINYANENKITLVPTFEIEEVEKDNKDKKNLIGKEFVVDNQAGLRIEEESNLEVVVKRYVKSEE